MAKSHRAEERRLLRDLEARYAGIKEEYTGGAIDQLDDESGASDSPAGAPELELFLSKATQRPALFDYQNELVQQALRLCSLNAPENIGLLALPTGAGKTRTAVCAVLELVLLGTARRVVWVAPTLELLDQAFDAFSDMWAAHGQAPDLRLTRITDKSFRAQGQASEVYFCTPQLLSSRIKKSVALPQADLVVFDEAHHLGAPTYRDAIRAIRDASGASLVGLSATPGRRDDAETEWLVEFFRGNLLTSEALAPSPVKVLQRRGILARLRFRSVPPASSRVIAPALMDDISGRLVRTALLIKKLEGDGRSLVFAPSVATANILELVLKREGVPAATVSSYTPVPERRRLLKKYAEGKIRVMLNKSVLATGYDCPAISDVFLTCPIRSPILFEQIVGRGSRGPAVGGSPKSNFWQFDDHLEMHGLPSSYYRFEDYDWKHLRA